VAFGSKFLAVNPLQLTPPANPPTGPFSGDTIQITASTPSAGVLEFTASGPNSTNVTTELLFQKVSNGNADPVDGAYKIAKYNKFQSGSLTTQVTVTPGYYAVGYRFVSTATGQMTAPVFTSIVGPVGFSVVEGGASSAPSARKKAA
jgi:hypothetical protein